jgi:hypothetical protein
VQLKKEPESDVELLHAVARGDEEALAAVVFAITLEPESGVQVPTGSIYFLSAS